MGVIDNLGKLAALSRKGAACGTTPASEPESPSRDAYEAAMATVEAFRKDRDRWADEAAMKAREILSLRIERDRAWADVEAAQRRIAYLESQRDRLAAEVAELRDEAGRLAGRAASLEARADRLEALEVTVRNILNQVNDDHCWLDWGWLYPEMAKLVGMPEWKPSVLPPEAMIRNCRHFVACLGAGESYEAPVITELEAEALRSEVHRLSIENADLRGEVDRLDRLYVNPDPGYSSPPRLEMKGSWSGLVEGE